jgi:hypothetical protein
MIKSAKLLSLIKAGICLDMGLRISNNEKSRKALSDLVNAGYYSGEVSPTKFVLTIKSCKNQYRIIGEVLDDSYYMVSLEYDYPIKFLSQVTIIGAFISMVVSLLLASWVIACVSLFFIIVPWVDYKSSERIRLYHFRDCFLRFYEKQLS